MSAAVRDPRPHVEPEVWQWTVTDYERAADAGIFGPEERLELIDGKIYRVSPQNGPHATTCELVEEALRSAFPAGYLVRSQKPLALGSNSMPELDVYVVRGRIRDFMRQHPTGADLVVEVSDATMAFDLGTKAILYAAAAIPEHWVVAIPERVVVVHREPDAAAGTYRRVVRLPGGETVSPLAAPDAILSIADLLP